MGMSSNTYLKKGTDKTPPQNSPSTFYEKHVAYDRSQAKPLRVLAFPFLK